MPGFKIEDFFPPPPLEGPPLPKGLGITWPFQSPFHVCMAKCMTGPPFLRGELVSPKEKFAYCAKQCKGLRKQP